jgi:protein phosphatase
VLGDVPSPKFGHSFTMVSDNKGVLFGGAIGDSGKFVITNDTFLFDFTLSRWKRINSTGEVPASRAAHSAAGIKKDEMVLFGGAASGIGGGLSDDELYFLEIEDKKEVVGRWRIIPIERGKDGRKTPGRRYGHAMVYNKPYVVVIGGNVGSSSPDMSSVVCDVWMINLDGPLRWEQTHFKGEMPAPRVYHSACLCQHDKTAGMIVVFGGRKDETWRDEKTGAIKKQQKPLNDCWGLRRHRTGLVDWVKAPLTTSAQPLFRFQHEAQFIGPYMFVLGGRTNGTPVPGEGLYEDSTSVIDVYDIENLQWLRFDGIYRYRHAMVAVQSSLYVHGGFNPMHPSLPLNSLHKIDIRKVLSLASSSPTPAPTSLPQASPGPGPVPVA